LLLFALQSPHHCLPPQQIMSERRNHCSLMPSNHFCNKIGPKPTWACALQMSTFG
jgi:hypothetical protein